MKVCALVHGGAQRLLVSPRILEVSFAVALLSS